MDRKCRFAFPNTGPAQREHEHPVTARLHAFRKGERMTLSAAHGERV